MITMQRLLALLIVATSLNLQGMGYLKSWFATPECLATPERKALFEELKTSADQRKISSGRILAIQWKSDGKDTCVLGELGKEKQAELYAQLDTILAEAKKPGFYGVSNLSAVDKAYQDANNIIRIIHLGSADVADTDHYKQAKKGVDILRDNLENLEDQARRLPRAAQSAAKS